jgi:large subunit ribosomal protein L3
MIKGAVPGSNGGWVTVKDAVKKKLPDGVPFPAAIKTTATKADATVAEAPVEGGEA